MVSKVSFHNCGYEKIQRSTFVPLLLHRTLLAGKRTVFVAISPFWMFHRLLPKKREAASIQDSSRTLSLTSFTNFKTDFLTKIRKKGISGNNEC